jgi:hypothetical protein
VEEKIMKNVQTVQNGDGKVSDEAQRLDTGADRKEFVSAQLGNWGYEKDPERDRKLAVVLD